ncbi:MAG: Gfo/Idh/MocA family oxidoreductase [Gemmataceae bacterium]|nr:Gfo/Idh/MocA family oxidoreductase [Gemmataceae bacterium]
MKKLNRREFSRQGGALAAGLFLAPSITQAIGPNDKIRIACVGVRGRGGGLLHEFASQPDVEVTHIADIDESVRTRRAAEIKDKTKKEPKLVVDYLDLLKDPSIDAFVIGTPDHWHALPAIHACLAGKDVYVEKPDGHNIVEGKTMVAAARKNNRMVQMGTQSRSATFLKEAVEYIRKGNIGKTIFARAWETDRQGAISKVPDSEPPKGVDYDLWLGAAPKKPFNSRRFHGNWRWFFDYGCGDLGNDGVHRLDYARWALGAPAWPDAISTAGGKFFFDDVQEWPDTMQVTYEYPGKILVYEMRVWSKPKLYGITEGAAIHGDGGWVLLSNSDWKAFDKDGKQAAGGTGPSPSILHVRNFLDCMRSRKRQELNQEIEQGHQSSVLCHAGNIAWRTGKKLRFNSATESFDDAEANRYLGREARKGFELPKV